MSSVTQARSSFINGARGRRWGCRERVLPPFCRMFVAATGREDGGLVTIIGQRAFYFCGGKVSDRVFWAGRFPSLLGLEATCRKKDGIRGLSNGGFFGAQLCSWHLKPKVAQVSW